MIYARFDISYPGFALDVDMQLPARGITALFGPSGSGKTTLLRCIAGLERTENGLLRVRDEVWQDSEKFLAAHRRPLGYVFQEYSLLGELTLLQPLSSPSWRQPRPRRRGARGDPPAGVRSPSGGAAAFHRRYPEDECP